MFNGFDLSTISAIYVGSTAYSEIYYGSTKIWPSYTPIPFGTVFNFSYTGTVQEIELVPGTYKLQCWGAQGGENPAYSTYGITSQYGGKGGYSEGILTLTSPTTLYIFVGGQPSTSSTNGGWNGGGGGSGTSQYGQTSDANYGQGYTKLGRGGGATDIALVTSTMSYSSYRTNRSSASYLSRFIVAGGGSGGYSAVKRIDATTTSYTWTELGTIDLSNSSGTINGYSYTRVNTTASSSTYYTQINFTNGNPFTNGDYVRLTFNCTSDGTTLYSRTYWTGSGTGTNNVYSNSTSNPIEFDYNYSEPPVSGQYLRIQTWITGGTTYATGTIKIEIRQTTTSTEVQSTLYAGSGYAGGGTNGIGSISYLGAYNSAGTGGGFGYGSNQSTTNYRWCGPCGGGGWYGGGSGYSDTTTNALGYSGGGSGFVNIAANAQYRPTDYTGLELDSGATYAGNTSFPSTSGSTETGHSGNGYARITCVDPKMFIPLTFDILGSGTIGWKTNNSAFTRTIQYKKNDGNWTYITSTTSGATISVSNGDVVQFRGNNTTYVSGNYYHYFTTTCNFNVRGNIMSMFSNSIFESLTTIPASGALQALFAGNIYLKDASALLMPATTLTSYCYAQMFSGCTNMTSAPALPATTVPTYCYYGMFYNCSNITTAPVLNATTVATYSYYRMFYGCSKLNYIKCLATNISATDCTTDWVNGVAATGTFVKSEYATWTLNSTSGIPTGWTTVDEEVPLIEKYFTITALGSGTIGWRTSNSSLTKTVQYSKNDGTWTSITSATTAVTISVVNGDVIRFKGDNTAYGTSSYYNYFTATCNFNVSGNIMSLINSTNFSTLATITGTYTFKNLFYQNTYLQSAENLVFPATTLTTYCYNGVFYSCTNLTIGPAILPATTLATNCYRSMFQGCSKLTTAPELPAATLVGSCYYRIFRNCTVLNYIKCLATSISASNCLLQWADSVASSGTFVKAANMSSWSTGSGGIPSGWTVQNATS